MEKILNITNGDSAAAIMQAGGVSGQILPWRDVLHDGPVPGNLDLHELSRVRSGFIVARGWGDARAVARGFRERDRMMERAGEFDLVRLWFEHDLYDQLQILQVLDWWIQNRPSSTALEMICIEGYLGEEKPDAIPGMMGLSSPVTAAQLALAGSAWQAFCRDSPEQFARLARLDTSALPFLGDAVVRLIEEYPDEATGLSLTERRVLEHLVDGSKTGGQLFAANQAAEERIYLGDLSFLDILNGLLSPARPLITREDGGSVLTREGFGLPLSLTPFGREVFDGTRSRVSTGFPTRWIGGVHLTLDGWMNGRWFPDRLLGR